MKYCPRCKKGKKESDFHRDKANPDGLQSNCRSCRSLLRRGNRYEKYDSLKHKKYKYIKNPLQLKVGNKIREMVRKNKIDKPICCQQCGKKTKKKDLSGHHFNGYEKPFDILWLCRLCHAGEHIPVY